MSQKPTYEELEYRVRVLENEARWRKQAEKALKESEERFKLLYEYAPDMYILCDTEGTLIDANRAAEKVSGYERSEVIGKNLLSVGIIPEHQARKAIELLYKITKKIPTGPEEITIVRKDGIEVNMELRAYSVVLAGRPVILTSARDISVHKEVLEQVSSREEKYRQAFETSPELLILLDAQTTLIEGANRAARAFFGISKADFLSIRLNNILDGSAETEAVAEIIKSKLDTPREVGCTLRTKTGETVEVKIIFRGFQIEGRQFIVGRVRLPAKNDLRRPPPEG